MVYISYYPSFVFSLWKDIATALIERIAAGGYPAALLTP
jgi:hypothetical protein